MTRMRVTFAPMLLALLFAPHINAAPLHLLLETDADAGPNQEIFIGTFATANDLINSGPGGSGGSFSGIDINPNFSIGGLAYDGMYRLLLETNVDAVGGQEIFIGSFATINDLINSGPGGSGGAFSGIDINPNFSVRGFAYDGMYRLLLETNADAPGGQEVFIGTFPTLNDLINSGPGGSGGSFSGIDINPNFSVAGFTYDGMYRLLLETDADAGANAEVFLGSFATFNDLINSGPGGSGGAFSGIDINPNFSIRGFATEFQQPVDPTPVSAPGSLSLLLAGLGLFGWSRRSRTAVR